MLHCMFLTTVIIFSPHKHIKYKLQAVQSSRTWRRVSTEIPRARGTRKTWSPNQIWHNWPPLEGSQRASDKRSRSGTSVNGSSFSLLDFSSWCSWDSVFRMRLTNIEKSCLGHNDFDLWPSKSGLLWYKVDMCGNFIEIKSVKWP